MPDPSVDPKPPDAEELRFAVPLDAQDASYFAASDKMASRSFNVFFIYVHYMFQWILSIRLEITGNIEGIHTFEIVWQSKVVF